MPVENNISLLPKCMGIYPNKQAAGARAIFPKTFRKFVKLSGIARSLDRSIARRKAPRGSSRPRGMQSLIEPSHARDRLHDFTSRFVPRDASTKIITARCLGLGPRWTLTNQPLPASTPSHPGAAF
jgi:hypothetical protein